MALLPPDTNTAFDRLLHKATAQHDEGLTAILKKDHSAQKAASEEYFRNWDGKSAQRETEADRAARRDDYASLTRQYVSLLISLNWALEQVPVV
jgi:sterol 24-C-methyltransferase